VHGVSERLLRRPSLKYVAEQLYAAMSEPDPDGGRRASIPGGSRKSTFVSTEVLNGHTIMEVGGGQTLH